MNTIVQNDELFLYDLFLILKKRYKIIIGSVVVGILLLGIIMYFRQPLYRTTFSIKAPSVANFLNAKKEPVISDFEIKTIIDKLSSDLKDTNRISSLSDKLGIQHDKLGAIANVTATPQHNLEEIMVVSVDVRDSRPVNDFKKGLLQILNEHVSKKMILIRNVKMLEKKEIEKKIGKIEELWGIVFTQIKNKELKYIGFNPLELQRDLIQFKMRSIEIENELSSPSEFETVTEPEAPERLGQKKVYAVALAVIISLIAGIFLSFIIEWFEINIKKPRQAT